MDVLDYLYVNGEKSVKPLPETEVKTDVHGYYKTTTGAVISKDMEGLAAYKKQKAKNAKLNNMEEKVNKLESDISEIKELLKGLVK